MKELAKYTMAVYTFSKFIHNWNTLLHYNILGTHSSYHKDGIKRLVVPAYGLQIAIFYLPMSSLKSQPVRWGHVYAVAMRHTNKHTHHTLGNTLVTRARLFLSMPRYWQEHRFRYNPRRKSEIALYIASSLYSQLTCRNAGAVITLGLNNISVNQRVCTQIDNAKLSPQNCDRLWIDV